MRDCIMSMGRRFLAAVTENCVDRLAHWIARCSLGLLVVGSASVCAHAAAPPNFLVITIDDLKRVIGVMADRPGNLLSQIYPDSQTRQLVRQILTPNIDRLASESLLFTNAYASAPVCNPSRIAMLTGVRPDVSGFTSNRTEFRLEPGGASLITLPQSLRSQGYYTTGVGKVFHKSKVTLAADLVSLVNDWPDTQYSWDLWINRPIGGTAAITYSPYSNTNGPIRFGQADVPLAQLADIKNAQYVADLLGNGSTTVYDSAYKKNIGVTLPDSGPFYLAAGLYLPHQPFIAPQSILDLFDVDDMTLNAQSIAAIEADLLDLSDGGQYVTGVQADGSLAGEFQALLSLGREVGGTGGDVMAWKQVVRHYLAGVAVADRGVGLMLDALNASDYADNTVVVLHSDHGFNLGEKNRLDKNDLWDESTGSVFMIRKPGVAAAVIENSVSLMDIYPTISALSGTNKPTHVTGNDLSVYFSNADHVWSKPSFTSQGASANRHAIRTNNYRFVRFYDDAANVELYDLRDDPDELYNLAGHADYQALQVALNSVLSAIRTESNSAPVIRQLPLQSVPIGSLMSIAIEAWQAEGQPLRFFATGLPSGLAIDSETGLISGIAQIAGRHPVVVTVTSESGSSNLSFAIEVVGTDVLAPLWGDDSAVSVEVDGATVTLSWPAATDNVAVLNYAFRYRQSGGAVQLVNSHSPNLVLNNLPAGRQYHFWVRAQDGAGNVSRGALEGQFSTSESNQSPHWQAANLVVTRATENTLQLQWSGARDDVAVVDYIVQYRRGAQLVESRVVDTPQVTLTDLAPATDYNVLVQARDSTGALSTDGPMISAQTSGGIDEVQPSWRHGLVEFTNIGSVSVDVNWTGATDNIAVDSYRLFYNNGLVPVVLNDLTGTSVRLRGLSPQTNYKMSVQAFDAAGNQSSNGPVGEFSTFADQLAPVWDEPQLRLTQATSASLSFEWSAATDEHSIYQYRIQYVINGVSDFVSTAFQTVTLEGLDADSSYTVSVQAIDAAGNVSHDGPAITSSTSSELPSVSSLAVLINESVAYFPISSASSQDRGPGLATLKDGGNRLELSGNVWKRIRISQAVNEETILEFDFQGEEEGEVHAIGLETNSVVSSSLTFQLWGTERFGLQNFANYDNAGRVKHYHIPLGQLLPARSYDYLTFISDHDRLPNNAKADFSNIVIRHGNGLGVDVEPPTWPSAELVLDRINPTQVNLSWTAAADNNDVVGYDIFVGEKWRASTTQIHYTLTVEPAYSHTVVVRARDVAGNVSRVNNPVANVRAATELTQSLTVIIDGVESSVEVGAFGKRDGGGGASVSEDGKALNMVGNSWKYIALGEEIGLNTEVSFDFSSSVEGALHAIAVESDLWPSSSKTFKLFGRKHFGLKKYDNYKTSKGVVRYRFKVGAHIKSVQRYLVFINDHDAANSTAQSNFSNIVITTAAKK